MDIGDCLRVGAFISWFDPMTVNDRLSRDRWQEDTMAGTYGAKLLPVDKRNPLVR